MTSFLRPLRFAILLSILGAAFVVPEPVAGQDRCNVARSDSVQIMEFVSGRRLIYATSPVITCVDGTRLQADSAEVNEAAGLTRLFGGVDFRDPTQHLVADSAEFYQSSDRLLAWGAVTLERIEDEARIFGDTLDYYRAGERRPQEQIFVRGERVRSSVPPRSGEGAPYDVESDRLSILGEGHITAIGTVRVRRDSLDARADTLVLDQDREVLHLGGNAGITGTSYELGGRSIDLEIPGDSLRSVRARGDPTLWTEEILLTAPEEIVIAMMEGRPEHLVAIGAPPRGEASGASGVGAVETTAPLRSRPKVESEHVILEGDSLDIMAPGGLLKEVRAIGSARGEALAPLDSIGPAENPSMPSDPSGVPETAPEHAAGDSLSGGLPALLMRDWIEGDTIIAHFVDPSPTPDEMADSIQTDAANPETSSRSLDRLIAIGNARSLYRVAPSDSLRAAAGERALHYVVGRRITVRLEEGEVDRMEVDGPAGVHLEPGVTGERTRDSVGDSMIAPESGPGDAAEEGEGSGGGAAESAVPVAWNGRGWGRAAA